MNTLQTVFLDEGPQGYIADKNTVTRIDKGKINPQEIINLPGEYGEEKLFAICKTGHYTQSEWNVFLQDLSDNGMQYAITIFKEKDGVVHIHEGNHRLRAAIELGREFVPIEIRYFGNSQRRGEIF